MQTSNRRRIWLAIVFSFLAHVTVLVALLPFFAIERAIRVLMAEENENLRIALILAILLHIAIPVPVIQWVLSQQPTSEDSDILSIDLWNRSDSVNREKEEKTPEEELEEYEPKEEIPEGQVVHSPPSKDKRKPKKPRFLAEHDSRVEKETRSKIRMPGVSKETSTKETPGKGTDGQTLKGGMRAEQHGVAPMPSNLERAEQGQRSTEIRAPPSLKDINLEPSMEAMASAIAGSGLDHLDGVIDADVTALNTMGWRYAAFFNRVKRKVERHWHPDFEYRRHDPYGNIYGFKDRITVLLVVLRGDGSLKKAYVLDPSGAPFLDDEAREAVIKAAPFPNVPAGLRDKRDGLVKFTFHFLVEVGERPVFRMRRYQ
ncbi:MAG: energy transducer TonB [Deltaproteobacteria bacterium]|nr:energy transducer TonB [Deltaproteobacteria bacterium]